MWVAILGGPGTCKGTIAEALARSDGFIVERETGTYRKRAPLIEQMGILTERYRLQRDIQRRQREEDILQVRTFWDVMEVYAPAMLTRQLLSDESHLVLGLAYNALAEALEAPSAVIYCHNNKRDTAARMAISKSEALPEEYLDAINAAYAKLVEKIRCPVLEVDASRPFDGLMTDLKAEITAIKATASTSGQSVWHRSFLKGG